jgi:hypothetical protein
MLIGAGLSDTPLEGRKRLLQILDEIREARDSRTVHRDHKHAGRCHACGYRTVCDEVLDYADWWDGSPDEARWLDTSGKRFQNRAALLAINPTRLPRTELLASFGLGRIYGSGG